MKKENELCGARSPLDRLWELTGAAAPRVTLRIFSAGSCRHPEWVTIRGGSLRSVRIPALFACIGHPVLGPVLFDTGYSERFFAETDPFPARLYRMVTPVEFDPGDSAARRLAAAGFDPASIRRVVVSHFHADHVAGLRDFPKAEFLYEREALDSMRRLRGIGAVKRGFLPGLLPEDFDARARPFAPESRIEVPEGLLPGFPFRRVTDVLGDGSLLAVDLPGHAYGQIGLLLRTERGPALLCADAAWSEAAYRENRPPSALAGIIMPDRRAYADSFRALRALHESFPELTIVASHCPEAERRYASGQVCP
ncbi:MBL fold metallo-hydrolase [Saccharibacillus alkalitolerans]|uniref:MBL fold metallo-hydrolase n=1 Tax=Saccharibacillus alkalitolerans TaxID=2705290 RepID=A0ABX0FAQ5_9BACL|nr:MBL fold metallo-hydrolase [Saccharibacillus alkalitolerans]NGZ76301.1 MBL fold metallo-hydrolase [Saccharibacillus alkalitolerans]